MPKVPNPAFRREIAIETDESCATCPPANNKLNADGVKNFNDGSAGSRHVSMELKEPCSWFEIHHLVRLLADQIAKSGKNYDCILAVSTGGLVPAKLLAEELGMDNIAIVPFREKKLVQSEMPTLKKGKRYIAVDDIYDSGVTYTQAQKALQEFDCDFAFCMSRYPDHPGIAGRILNHNRWIVFPWEKEIR